MVSFVLASPEKYYYPKKPVISEWEYQFVAYRMKNLIFYETLDENVAPSTPLWTWMMLKTLPILICFI